MPAPTTGTAVVEIASIDTSSRTREDLGDLLGLSESIRRYGLMNPIIVEKKTMKLVAGLRRIEAMKILKRDTIEVRYYEELKDWELRKIELEENIVHKKSVTWQEEVALKRELHDLYMREHAHENSRRGQRETQPWSQKNTAAALGIATSTLSDDLRLAQAIEQFPELKNVTSKKDAIRKMFRLRELAILQELARRGKRIGKGDDPVVFYNGDCLTIMPELANESIDLIITDPPWGIDLKDLAGAGAVDYKMFTDDQATGHDLYARSIPEFWRLLKKGCHLYLFFDIESYALIYTLLRYASIVVPSVQKYDGAIGNYICSGRTGRFYQVVSGVEKREVKERDLPKDRTYGFDVRPVPMVWIKDKPGYTDWEYKPMPQYENIFFCVKNVDGTARRLTDATSDVLTYNRPEKKIHPTEKPVQLLKRLILLSSAENDLILDPFAGSAVTLLAATITKRRAIGIEKEAEYFNTAQGRLIHAKLMAEDGELDDETISNLATTPIATPAQA